MSKVLHRFIIKLYTGLNKHNGGQLKNILLSLFFKGAGVLINFYIFRVGLLLLGNDNMGVWLTISSISSWISFFDFGIGNGIKNKITEAVCNENYELANVVISTGYFISVAISTGLVVIFFFISFFINWTSLLNAQFVDYSILKLAVLVSLVSFAVRLSTDLILVVMTALHKAYYAALVSFLSNFFSLLFLFVLQYYQQKDFLLFVIGIVAIPILPILISTVLFFSSKKIQLRPSVKNISLQHLHEFLNVGSSFFIIQIMYLIIFTTDNLIIAKLFKPEEVTIYNTAYKYFGIVSFIFAILITPFWPVITRAHYSGETADIKKLMRTLLLYWGLSLIIVAGMAMAADSIYSIWTKNQVMVPFSLTLAMAVYIIVSTWNSVFATYLNAISKIKLQVYFSVIAGILNIPLCYFFAVNLHLGIVGVICATIACLLIGSFFAPIQYYFLINQKAKGIWNK